MRRYYGGHISIKNGIVNAIEEIIGLGGNFIQIFVSNPISTKIINLSKKFNDKIINNINKKLKESETKIVIHLPYVLNIGRQPILENPIENNWWIKMICEHLILSEKINSIGCIIHVGKHLKLTPNEGIENMYKNLKIIIDYLKTNNMKTHIILETGAGQGTELLSTKENSIIDLANFYNSFSDDDKKYFRLCIDTCHIFSAGYDLNKKKSIEIFFNDFEKYIGLRYIDLIHLNNSKFKCNCNVDRHANLYEGEIDIKNIKKFIKYSLINNLPLILETPNEYDEEIKLIKEIEKKII